MIQGINTITVSGHAGRDAETKTFESGVTICRFNVAVNNNFSKDKPKPPLWLTVKAFGKTAEFCATHVKKGIGLWISGHLECENWTKPDGTPGTANVLYAEHVRLNYEPQGAQNGATAQPQPQAQPAASAPGPVRVPPPSRPSQGNGQPPIQILDDDFIPF